MKLYLAAPILLLSLAGCHEGSQSNEKQGDFIGFNKNSSFEEVKNTVKKETGIELPILDSNGDGDHSTQDDGVANIKLHEDSIGDSESYYYHFVFENNQLKMLEVSYHDQLSTPNKNKKIIENLKAKGIICNLDPENFTSKCNDEATSITINMTDTTLTHYYK